MSNARENLWNVGVNPDDIAQVAAEQQAIENQFGQALPGYAQLRPAINETILNTPGLSELHSANPALGRFMGWQLAAAQAQIAGGGAPQAQAQASQAYDPRDIGMQHRATREAYLHSEFKRRIQHPDLDWLEGRR